LKAMQRADGCFAEHGRIYQSYMHSAGDKKAYQRQDLLLTSYVLSAISNAPTILKESQGSQLNVMSQNAKICILNTLESLQPVNISTSVLTKALYALSRVVDEKSEAYLNMLLGEVEKRAKVESSLGDEQTWWSDDTGSSASDVEATAYVFLAMQELKPDANTMPIVRWLSKQQKEQGGFYSTQDTVLALQALSVAALKLKTGNLESNNPVKISVKLASLNATVATTIDQTNADIAQQFVLGYHSHQTENTVHLQLTSSQPTCVAVHISSIYNTPLADKTTLESFFSLEVSSSQGSESMSSCTQAMTTVCASLTEAAQRGQVDTGMIVMSLEIPSGWTITEADLMNVAKNPSLNRVEIAGSGQMVNAYFSAFSQAEVIALNGAAAKLHRCVSLPLRQRMYVESSEAALANVIDYSNPHIKSETCFKLNSCKRYWVEDPREEPESETTVAPVTQDPKLTTPAPVKCPICVMPKVSEIIQRLNDTLCRYSGTFSLFQQNSTADDGLSFSGRMYQISYKTTVASWRTKVSLAVGCHCASLVDGTATAIFSPYYGVFAGDAELSLAGRLLLPLSEIREAASEFIKQQALKKPNKEDEVKRWRWCSRSEGLNGLLRKLSNSS